MAKENNDADWKIDSKWSQGVVAAGRQSRLDNLLAKACRSVNGGALAPFILPLTVLYVFATLVVNDFVIV